MTPRRSVLTGLAACALLPRIGWANAGNPAFLAAAQGRDGTFALWGLTETGQPVFSIPLPGRGHAAAAHPILPLAVAFARRPGRFALVVDCAKGRVTHNLKAPNGRHFYGHGVFSPDGNRLYTTENDYDQARGVIGIWEVATGFRRLGEFHSGGLGPHDLKLMPNGKHLVIANGGIETHPDSGRTKLNLATMRPNLSILTLDGAKVIQHEPPAPLRRNSMRHLAVFADGTIAVACQWQGDPHESPPLLGLCDTARGLRFFTGPPGMEREMAGYAGSIAVSGDQRALALTGPRGGLAAIFAANGRFDSALRHRDICGAAPFGSGFAFTTGTGAFLTHRVGTDAEISPTRHARQWDNHLVPIRPV